MTGSGDSKKRTAGPAQVSTRTGAHSRRSSSILIADSIQGKGSAIPTGVRGRHKTTADTIPGKGTATPTVGISTRGPANSRTSSRESAPTQHPDRISK